MVLRCGLWVLERRGKGEVEARDRVAWFETLDFWIGFVLIGCSLGLEIVATRQAKLFVLACLWVLVKVVMRFGGLVLVVGRSIQLWLVCQECDALQRHVYCD